ncbi:MAG: AAA family ATPase, partial [Opitutales bacterium]|nr:AAA family ATPase [Opitutales bacterium]
GKFNEDLYLRLNAFSIHLPNLRDRRSDITLLAEFFINKFNKKHKKKVKRISTPAINLLMLYHWPANIRELENAIESAVLSASDSVIYGYNLPASLQTGQSTNTSKLSEEAEVDFTAMVRSFERELISEALKIHRGNATAAARHLGISQRIMNYKIKNLGIDSSIYKKNAKPSRRKM